MTVNASSASEFQTDEAGQRKRAYRRTVELVVGQLVSQALQVVTRLGVPDSLAEGPKAIEELAADAGADTPSLYRVLRCLTSYDVFEVGADGRFALGPVGEMLRSGPHTLNSFVQMFGAAWNQGPFGELESLVKTGAPAFQTSMQMPFFEYLETHGAEGALFDTVMTDFLEHTHKAAVEAYDFNGTDTVVDVGGGNGSLMIRLLEQYPGLVCKVLDRPAVQVRAEEELASAGCASRCQFVAGDFFDSVPAGADLYILSRVIHDWDDADAVEILKRCRTAIPTHGRLLLVEQLMDPNGKETITSLTDLWMLLMFDKGRERTIDEFRHLLDQADFVIQEIIPTAATDCVLEVVPKRAYL